MPKKKITDSPPEKKKKVEKEKSSLKRKNVSSKYYSLSEQEMQNLIIQAKQGSETAMLELLKTFDNFLQKYTTLLYEGKMPLADYDIRRFCALFIKDINLRRALTRNKTSAVQRKQINEVMRGIVYMVKRYNTKEDVHQTVQMCFLSCFSGETEYITRDGLKTFRETVGTTQQVLAAPLFKGDTGKNYPTSKLTFEEVKEIRELYFSESKWVRNREWTQQKLADKFDVRLVTIKNLVNGRTYTHIEDEGGLTPIHKQRKAHSEYGGHWVNATIESFGIQPLWKLTLERSGKQKEIFTTANHRWWIYPHTNTANKYQLDYNHKIEVTTDELSPGNRLLALFPKSSIFVRSDTVPSPIGIMHGFVFGDGSKEKNGGSYASLFGEKDAALLPYFPSVSRSTIIEGPVGKHWGMNCNGVECRRILDLPTYFKDRPPRNESPSYLYGWLAGYFAADGNVSGEGFVELDCADRETLEFVRIICNQLGIGTLLLRGQLRKGVNGIWSMIYTLGFVANTLTSDFFLIPQHRVNFEARAGNREPVGWRVISVEPTDRVEEVFCAVVPEHGNFTLDGHINTLNCSKLYQQRGEIPFSAFLYSYYFYKLKKEVDNLLIDQLGRKTFPLISDEDANVDDGSEERPPGFVAPPTPSAEDLIMCEEINEDWVHGDCSAPFIYLSTQERQLLKWRYVDGERSADIASRTLEHSNSLREQINRIKVRLRAYVEEDLAEV